jgi:NADH:ubiquinone oxidoreductase subunit E
MVLLGWDMGESIEALKHVSPFYGQMELDPNGRTELIVNAMACLLRGGKSITKLPFST